MIKKFILGCFVVLSFCLQAQQSDFAHIDFSKADMRAAQFQGEALEMIPVLTYNLTATLSTDVEKLRAIYYWIAQNIEGDNALQAKNERMLRKYDGDAIAMAAWQRTFRNEVFKTLKEDKKTVCTGYAYLLQVMARQAGLQCELINGYGLENGIKKSSLKGPNHSWNRVLLNGKWYYCDLTWAAGYTEVTTDLFEFDYDDRYFLQNPVEFAKHHFVK